jgi:hypothetical protein
MFLTINKYTVAGLKAFCVSNKIQIDSKMKKQEILMTIKSHMLMVKINNGVEQLLLVE